MDVILAAILMPDQHDGLGAQRTRQTFIAIFSAKHNTQKPLRGAITEQFALTAHDDNYSSVL